MKFFAVPAVLLGLGASAFAKPGVSFWSSKLMARATTDPTVTYPYTGTIWASGDIHNITWDTTGLSPPTCGAVLNTAIYLAQDGAILDDGSVGSTSQPIVANFSLSTGRVEIYVPNVNTTDNNYQIVLKADTSDEEDEGNFSGQFVIQAPATTSSASS